MSQNLERITALDQYRLRAGVYDLELAAFEPIRRHAITRLDLRKRAIVLDVGCGTGLSFSLLQEAVGSQGRIIGIEQCPEMLDQARARVARHGWSNVTLLEAPAETAKIACKADAALFHFTHDILCRDAAIHNVVRHLKPGAHVVAVGLKWAEPWAWAINCFVLATALHSVTSLEGLTQPWRRLAELIGEMDVGNNLMGGIYIASGTVGVKPL